MPIENNRFVSRFNNAARRAAASPDGGASGRLGETPAEAAAPPVTVDVASIVDDAGRRLAKASAATNTASAQAQHAARRQRATLERAAFVAEAKAAQESMRQMFATAKAEPTQSQRPAENPEARPKSPPMAPKAARQPPAQHQFKAGQSGNPAGRPKGSRNKVTSGNFARVLLEEAARVTPEGDGVSAHRAAVRKLFARAAEGDVRAATLILPMATAAEDFVAELDDMAEAREAEIAEQAEALERQAAYAEFKRAEVADEEALAAQLAAEDPQVYKHARELMKPMWGANPAMAFDKAVAQARVQIAIGQRPGAPFDPHLAAAALARAQVEEADE